MKTVDMPPEDRNTSSREDGQGTKVVSDESVATGSKQKSSGVGKYPDGRFRKNLTSYLGQGSKLSPTLKRRRPIREELFDLGFDDHFDTVRNSRAVQFQGVTRSFTQEQRLDVEAIGFGGLLQFQTEGLPDQMNGWLLNNFCPEGQNFEVGGKVRFSVTAIDARRVFGLKYSPSRSVKFDRKDGAVLSLLRDWKRRYGVPRNLLYDIDDLQSVMCRLEKGGDDFKRIFVMYAMKMVLTPDFGICVDVGLLKSLLNVNEIEHVDWAGHVVTHLCDAIVAYKNRPSARGCQGCLVLIQITYFQNTIWKGVAPLDIEPLIQHWKGKKLGKRVMDEIRAGSFGRALFKKKKFGEDELQPHPSVHPSPLRRKVGATNNVPPWTDEQLSQGISDDKSRELWKVLREVETVIKGHSDRFNLQPQILRDYCFSPLAENHLKFDARLGFDLVVNNLLNVCCSVVPQMRIPSQVFYSEPNDVGEGSESSDQELRPWTKWVFNYPPTFQSELLKKCSTLCHNFPQYKLELADFCMATGEFRETLFHDGGTIWLDRSDFRTLEVYQHVNASIVNAFSRVLNYDWSSRGMTTRICLGLLRIEKEAQCEKVLAKQWKDWLVVNQAKIYGTAFVFIPILVKGTFFLVVVNFLDEKFQWVDSGHHQGENMFETTGRFIRSSFSLLLEMVYDDRVEDFDGFEVEHITPHWTVAAGDKDGGICTMHMMERFTGSLYGLHKLSLAEANKRIQLRVAYLCFLVLSEVNKRRLPVIDKAGEFLARKGGLG